jgi:hypothetical protein
VLVRPQSNPIEVVHPANLQDRNGAVLVLDA